MPETVPGEENVLDTGIDSSTISYVSGIRHPDLVKILAGQVRPSRYHLARLARVLRSEYNENAFARHSVPALKNTRTFKGALPEDCNELKLVTARDVQKFDFVAYNPASRRVGGHSWIRVIKEPEIKGSRVRIPLDGESEVLYVTAGPDHPVMVARTNSSN